LSSTLKEGRRNRKKQGLISRDPGATCCRIEKIGADTRGVEKGRKNWGGRESSEEEKENGLAV